MVTVETINGVVQPGTQKTTRFVPNPVGNPNSITYPDGGVETLVYDTRGRLTRQRLEHQLPVNPFVARETVYTRVGGRVTKIDHPDGSYESFVYNVYGQTTEHRMRNGATETNTYDVAGRRLTHVDAVGVKTAFTYNSRDLLQTAILDPVEGPPEWPQSHHRLRVQRSRAGHQDHLPGCDVCPL